jgi:hypothetical protein
VIARKLTGVQSVCEFWTVGRVIQNGSEPFRFELIAKTSDVHRRIDVATSEVVSVQLLVRK